MPLTEDELQIYSQRVKTGAIAFDRLWEHCEPAVRGVLRYYGGAAEEVKDTLGETYLRAWTRCRTYDPDIASFCTWVKTIAVNKLKDLFRKTGRRQELIILQSEFPDLTDEDGDDASFDIGLQEDPGQLSPEDAVIKFEQSQTLLCCLFTKGGPPHHTLAFLFNKLLCYGPKRIVEEISDTELFELAERGRTEYREQSGIPARWIDPCFKILDVQLTRSAEEVNHGGHPGDPSPLAVVVGRTMLNEYYGKDPEHDISQWSYRVAKKVLKAYLSGRCP